MLICGRAPHSSRSTASNSANCRRRADKPPAHHVNGDHQVDAGSLALGPARRRLNPLSSFSDFNRRADRGDMHEHRARRLLDETVPTFIEELDHTIIGIGKLLFPEIASPPPPWCPPFTLGKRLAQTLGPLRRPPVEAERQSQRRQVRRNAGCAEGAKGIRSDFRRPAIAMSGGWHCPAPGWRSARTVESLAHPATSRAD